MTGLSIAVSAYAVALAPKLSVAATDIYIRLLMAGLLHDPRWIA